MSQLIEHLERRLGPIHTGWTVDPDGVSMPFQIVRFAGGADERSVGYSTIGLSNHRLTSRVSGRHIRQELFVLAEEHIDPDLIVSLLYQVGCAAVQARQALLRGQVIGPAGTLFPGTKMTALYVTVPVYFPDDFATIAAEAGNIVVSWLVPIGDREAAFVAEHGWSLFEDQLVDQDPDLISFDRGEIGL